MRTEPISDAASCGTLSTGVWSSLLNAVHRGQVTFEDVGAVETLLKGAATAWAEIADHGSLVVSKGVSVLVILSGEALDVIVTGHDRTLLRPLILVSKEMGLQVFDLSPTRRDRADTFNAVG